MDHSIAKSLVISDVVELIANKEKITINEARDKLYKSKLMDLIDNDNSGLYGESSLYVFSLYEKTSK